jgi:hypothetical protein
MRAGIEMPTGQEQAGARKASQHIECSGAGASRTGAPDLLTSFDAARCAIDKDLAGAARSGEDHRAPPDDAARRGDPDQAGHLRLRVMRL